MIVSGFTYRSIPSQTGVLGLDAYLSISSGDKLFQYGLSGTGGEVFKFSFGSGRVYNDSWKHVASYRSEQVNVKTVFNGIGGYDAYVDGHLVSLNANIGSYKYDYLFADSRDNMPVLGRFFLSGEPPDFSISGSLSWDESGLLTGYIKNNNVNKNFRVYGVELSGDSIYESGIFVSGFSSGVNINPTGYFLLSSLGESSFLSGYDNINLAFKTDGGIIYKNVQSNNYLDPLNLTIDIFGGGDILNGFSGTLLASIYSNYDISDLKVYLNHVTGSGQKSGLITGSGTNGTGNVSGFIVGSGYLWGTGVSSTLYGSGGRLSGLATGTISNAYGTYGPVYATGEVVVNYNLLVRSAYSGSIFRADLTGSLTGVIDGDWNNGSGYYVFSRTITGAPQGKVYTETYGWCNYDSSMPPFTGSILRTGVKSQYLSGNVSGPKFKTTGMIYVDEGIKTFSGTWNLLSGNQSDIYDYDYKTNGQFVENSFRRIGNNPMFMGFTNYYLGITYDHNFVSQDYDSALLLISGSGITGGVIITGYNS